MISAIITSYKEPYTIGTAIRALASQLSPKDEIIVTAPDKETRDAAKRTNTHGVPLTILKDPGQGKPHALNQTIRRARNELILLTDGDVHVDARAVNYLALAFQNPTVGIATGRVVSTNPRNTMLGFWAHILTESFHELRLHQKEEMIATGYLYMIRKNLFPHMPPDTLADDAYVSHEVMRNGRAVVYEPRARVKVKYPTTLPDWLRQKKRTAGRVYQLSSKFHLSKLRASLAEAHVGLTMIQLVRTPDELAWFISLLVLKLYIWARVFFDVRLWKRSFPRAWERVETTK